VLTVQKIFGDYLLNNQLTYGERNRPLFHVVGILDLSG